MSLLNDNIAQAQEIERLTKKCRALEERLRKKPKSSVKVKPLLAYLDDKIAKTEKLLEELGSQWLLQDLYRRTKAELQKLKEIRTYILENEML